jgi:hypothetical protein
MTKRHNSQPGPAALSSRRAIFVLLILILPPMMGVPASAHNGTAFIQRDTSLYSLSWAEQRQTGLTPPDWSADVSAMPSTVLHPPQGMVPVPTNKVADLPFVMGLPRADNGLSSGPDRRIRPRRSRRSTTLSSAQAAAPETTMFQALLIQTIDTSLFSPPSPDPAGIAYLDSSNALLIADSEVNEMRVFAGDNLFISTLTDGLLGTADTIPWSHEPTGAAYDPNSGHFFLSDDDLGRIFEIDRGPDRVYDTGDDVVTSFSTIAFGSYDPEGVAFAEGLGTLFIADGISARVYRVRPGANGRFDGVPPGGDDQVKSFDVAPLGVTDAEGIAFNPENGHLYLVGRSKTRMAEMTAEGTLVQMIDISAANAVRPAGLACGPSSLDPRVMHIYIADRGIDNDVGPYENDGKVYEMTLPPTTFRIYLPCFFIAFRP